MNETLLNDHNFMNSGDQGAASFFKINACMDSVMVNNRQPWYTACPDCKKKVMPVDNFGGSSSMWSCERCSKTFPDCNYVYNFTMRLTDYSENLFVGALGEYLSLIHI